MARHLLLNLWSALFRGAAAVVPKSKDGGGPKVFGVDWGPAPDECVRVVYYRNVVVSSERYGCHSAVGMARVEEADQSPRPKSAIRRSD